MSAREPITPDDFTAEKVLVMVDLWMQRRAIRQARWALEDAAFRRAIEDLKERRELRRLGHEHSIKFIDSQIGQAIAVLRETTGLKTWDVPAGRVGIRKQPQRLEVTATDEDLAAWLWSNVPAEVTASIALPVKLVTETKVPRRELLAFVKATGILPDGVELVEGGEGLQVSPNRATPELLALADEIDPPEEEAPNDAA